jgi:hypothetical protein
MNIFWKLCYILRLSGFWEVWPYTLMIHDNGITWCVERVIRWDWIAPRPWERPMLWDGWSEE